MNALSNVSRSLNLEMVDVDELRILLVSWSAFMFTSKGNENYLN